MLGRRGTVAAVTLGLATPNIANATEQEAGAAAQRLEGTICPEMTDDLRSVIDNTAITPISNDDSGVGTQILETGQFCDMDGEVVQPYALVSDRETPYVYMQHPAGYCSTVVGLTSYNGIYYVTPPAGSGTMFNTREHEGKRSCNELIQPTTVNQDSDSNITYIKQAQVTEPIASTPVSSSGDEIPACLAVPHHLSQLPSGPIADINLSAPVFDSETGHLLTHHIEGYYDLDPSLECAASDDPPMCLELTDVASDIEREIFWTTGDTVRHYGSCDQFKPDPSVSDEASNTWFEPHLTLGIVRHKEECDIHTPCSNVGVQAALTNGFGDLEGAENLSYGLTLTYLFPAFGSQQGVNPRAGIDSFLFNLCREFTIKADGDLSLQVCPQFGRSLDYNPLLNGPSLGFTLHAKWKDFVVTGGFRNDNLFPDVSSQFALGWTGQFGRRGQQESNRDSAPSSTALPDLASIPEDVAVVETQRANPNHLVVAPMEETQEEKEQARINEFVKNLKQLQNLLDEIKSLSADAYKSEELAQRVTSVVSNNQLLNAAYTNLKKRFSDLNELRGEMRRNLTPCDASIRKKQQSCTHLFEDGKIYFEGARGDHHLRFPIPVDAGFIPASIKFTNAVVHNDIAFQQHDEMAGHFSAFGRIQDGPFIVFMGGQTVYYQAISQFLTPLRTEFADGSIFIGKIDNNMNIGGDGLLHFNKQKFFMIYESNSNQLFILTKQGKIQITYNSGQFTVFDANPEELDPLTVNDINAVNQERLNQLLAQIAIAKSINTSLRDDIQKGGMPANLHAAYLQLGPALAHYKVVE